MVNKKKKLKDACNIYDLSDVAKEFPIKRINPTTKFIIKDLYDLSNRIKENN